MRLLVTAFVLSLLIAPIAAMAQSPATIQVAAGSSSTVTLPPRIDPTAVQVLFRGAPATGVSAKLGRDGVDRTLEVTADRRARAGAGYAIRLTSGTSKVPTDIPLEILTSGRTSELALLPAPASTETLAAPSFTFTVPVQAVSMLPDVIGVRVFCRVFSTATDPGTGSNTGQIGGGAADVPVSAGLDFVQDVTVTVDSQTPWDVKSYHCELLLAATPSGRRTYSNAGSDNYAWSQEKPGSVPTLVVSGTIP